MAAPSMVSRSGDSLVVRSVVSGAALYRDVGDEPHSNSPSPPPATTTSPSPSVSAVLFDNEGDELGLPQCKIKRSYMCPRCTFYTQNPRVYLYHLKSVHHEKIKVFECPHCLYASKHSQKLQRHVTMVHAPGKEVSKPPPPPKPPKSKAKAKSPRRPVPMLLPAGREHLDGEEDYEGRLVIDDAKDDKSGSERVEQVVVCTEEEVAMDAAAQQNGAGVFLCSVCSFTSRSESLMTRHERIVHLKKKIFRCSRCSYVTNLKSRFTKHVKYHTMPLIKCGQCDFKTAYKWNLDRHHRNHGGPGAFHCTVCNFAADIKQSLTVHEMNHHVPVVGSAAAAAQNSGARRRFNKVGGSDCGLATEEDAIDADELELLRLEREETAPPQEGEATAMTQSKVGTGTTTKKKPLPPLIPLPNKGPKAAKTPPLSERDLNEICAKSCPTSSLKDFASLIGDADAFKTKEEDGKDTKTTSSPPSPSHSPSHAKPNGKAATASPKKTFFDKLKEKLATDGQAGLVCATCGLEARCLSELVLHQQQQHGQELDADNSSAAKSLQASSRSRCPHCRHRCKSSADLVQHLKGCSQVPPPPQNQGGADGETNRDAQPPPPPPPPHPMENKVFVWNNMPASTSTSSSADHDSSNSEEQDFDDSKLMLNDTVVQLTGVETAPGYGSVTPENGNDPPLAAPVAGPTSIKKVFKCPHCSFWASTASRFHVHIVGHLNKKPFECSLCAYRSNWRWDITKHIRLKSARDPSHERARLLMTDETGRRNYSKYNKHLTLMRVTEQKMDPPPGTRQSKAAANGQQGNVAPGSSEPIPILPAPPKLTRAPVPRASSQSTPVTTAPVLRPPPPLQAAAHVYIVNPSQQQGKQDQPAQTLKRPAGSQEPETEAKRANTDNKKTVWRCKQCHFRDGDRAVVLAHVKGHYRQPAAENDRSNRAKQDEVKAPSTSVPTSNQQKGDQSAAQVPAVKKSTPPLLEPNGVHCCESCKFTTNSLETLAAHAEFHKPHVDAIFKCYFCPYYVQTKEELLQHMVVHGVSQDEEFVQKTVMIKVTSPITSPPATPAPAAQAAPQAPPQAAPSEPSPRPETPPSTCQSSTTPMKGSDSAESDGSSPKKRYSCSSCPYVSNSKSQFLYHKQFHRTRGAIFKCSLCSYNVSRRHLLNQHLKVHGVNEIDKEAPSGTEPMDVDPDDPADILVPNINTKDLKDIPVCWILRNGKLVKMFKCRFCPHVNLRRTNIQEHERMHSDRPAKPWEAIQPHQRLTCELCSYTCNNAGVLSSHSKVHAADYARLCAIVDPYRKEEEQIKELSEQLNLKNVAVASAEVGELAVESPAKQESGNRDGNESSLSIRSLLKTSGGVKGALLEEHDENGVEDKYSTDKCPIDKCPTDRVTRSAVDNANAKEETMLLFCQCCPARFLYAKELNIHWRFHSVKLAHQCPSCSYTARHSAHLSAHLKVHTQEYHERTNALFKMYPVHRDYAMPLHTCLKDGNDRTWVVPSDEIADKAAMSLTTELTSSDVSARLARDVDNTAWDDEKQKKGTAEYKAKHSCHKCPATFFKPVALQYHLTLHGANHPHKCRVCDYAVKTYGNLAKHEMIHGPRDKLKRYHGTATASANANANQERSDSESKRKDTNDVDVDSLALPNDQLDQPDIEKCHYQGSPDFVYPTYQTKNGQTKEKKFKCWKCPSAFEKKEQFAVHITLHGAKQRYVCQKCDYSVKYYANYVQHMTKHLKSDQAKAEDRKREESSLAKMAALNDGGEPLDDGSSEGMQTAEKSSRQSPLTASPQRSMKTINRGPLALSMADRQTMMVMQQRRASGILSSRVMDKNYWCLHCPYSNPRRDGIDSHMRRHVAVSGVRSVYTCDYCDYTVPTQHFLREHTKIHFAVDKLPRPDTFMTCNKIELWSGWENQEKQLVFQDKGTSANDRFVPVLNVVDDGDTKKIFVNPNTGETISFHSNGDVQPEWDSCSEGTNKSEMVVVARNGEVAPSQSSLTTDASASDTASSTGCSSRSSAASDMEDEPVSHSDSASVPLPPLPHPLPSTQADLPCQVDPDKTEPLTDAKED